MLGIAGGLVDSFVYLIFVWRNGRQQVSKK